MRLSVCMMKDAFQQPLNFLLIMEDITERKKIEEELHKVQRLESLGILVGGIAHDFRNILMGIVGTIPLVKLYVKPGDKVFGLLNQAEKAATRATDLSQQLLTFAKEGAPIKKTSSFYLPASMEDVPVVDGPQPKIQPQAQVNHKRVLFLEDEEMVRDTAKSMLQFLGYEVELAWDGIEAIELYKQALESGQPFEAVIMDLIIPGGMGGEETVQKLREVDPEVKAIVSSGYTNDPVLAEFERYGFKAAIAKPYKAKDLAKTLQSIARGSGSDRFR